MAYTSRRGDSRQNRKRKGEETVERGGEMVGREGDGRKGRLDGREKKGRADGREKRERGEDRVQLLC